MNDFTPRKKMPPAAWLPCLIGALAFGGSAPAHAAGPAVPAAAAAAGVTYRITNLSGENIDAVLINARGQVAFTEDFITMDPGPSPPTRSRFYDGTRFYDLGLRVDGGPVVTGLNDVGQVVLQRFDADTNMHSFVWSTAQGAAQDIGRLPGFDETWRPAINNLGQITGYADSVNGHARAFRWSAADGMRNLGTLANTANAYSYGRAINDAGMIAGMSSTSAHTYHAFVWMQSTGPVDIDTLGTPFSDPVAIGAGGQVAGNVLFNGGEGAAFVWTRAKGMRLLRAAGWPGSQTVAMSSGGRVAGFLFDAGGGRHAMTWTEESGTVDLGAFGNGTTDARAANNKGQVVGEGTLPGDTETHAFVWTAGAMFPQGSSCTPPRPFPTPARSWRRRTRASCC